jgi:hypothetical protein
MAGTGEARTEAVAGGGRLPVPRPRLRATDPRRAGSIGFCRRGASTMHRLRLPGFRTSPRETASARPAGRATICRCHRDLAACRPV